MVDSYHIALSQMMENAGRDLAEMARRTLHGQVREHPITILCGPGNNGGGGMVAARHLHNWGARVNVVLAAKSAGLREVSRGNGPFWRRCISIRSSSSWNTSDLLLDALLGYGATGDPRPPIRQWIERANASGLASLSLDSPSGLDTTTGRAGQPCIRAAATMTLALPKTGLLVAGARDMSANCIWRTSVCPPTLRRAVARPVCRADV